jgi:hypothetical protein
MGCSRWTNSLGWEPVKEKRKTLVTEAPLILSGAGWWNVKWQDEHKALRLVASSCFADALCRGITIKEHLEALVAKAPLVLRSGRRRNVMGQDEHEALAIVSPSSGANAFVRRAVKEHCLTFLAVAPLILSCHSVSFLSWSGGWVSARIAHPGEVSCTVRLSR